MKDNSVIGTEITAPLVAHTGENLKIISLTKQELYVPIVRDIAQELQPINQKLTSLFNKVHAHVGKRSFHIFVL